MTHIPNSHKLKYNKRFEQIQQLLNEGKNFKSISKILNITEGAVRSSYYYGIKRNQNPSSITCTYKDVVLLIKQGMSIPEIANKFDLDVNAITSRKNYAIKIGILGKNEYQNIQSQNVKPKSEKHFEDDANLHKYQRVANLTLQGATASQISNTMNISEDMVAFYKFVAFEKGLLTKDNYDRRNKSKLKDRDVKILKLYMKGNSPTQISIKLGESITAIKHFLKRSRKSGLIPKKYNMKDTNTISYEKSLSENISITDLDKYELEIREIQNKAIDVANNCKDVLITILRKKIQKV